MRGLDFIGPFVSSFGKQFIFTTVDDVLKWAEPIVLPTTDSK